MWKTGRIGAPGSNTIYEYHAKVYEEGSHFGIDGGRISKLEIRKLDSRRCLYHYDRDLDIDCADDEVRAVYNIILKKYN